jgi:hypothetical protein
MTPLLSRLLRLIRCRRNGHLWTTMCEPPACARCGRTGWYA